MISAAPYPYKHRTKRFTRTTNGSGRYRLRVKPDYNTRYFVRTAGSSEPSGPKGRSHSTLVAVAPVYKLNVDTHGHVAVADLSFGFSPKLPTSLEHRRITWYFRKQHARRFKPVAHSFSRVPRAGHMTGHVRYRLPTSRHGYRYSMTECVTIGHRRDVGLAPPQKHGSTACPETPIPAGKLATR